MTFPRVSLALTLSLALVVSVGGCATSPVEPTPSATSPSIDQGDGARRYAPDAIGVIVSMTVGVDTMSVLFAPDLGFEYFDGTTFTLTVEDGTNGIDGADLDPADLAVGDHIRVWVGACAESFPVQCDVEHVDRIDPAVVLGSGAARGAGAPR